MAITKPFDEHFDEYENWFEINRFAYESELLAVRALLPPLMVTTICFLDDVEMGIKEAYRVIKNGGSLIIGFVDKTSTLGQLYLKHKNESVFYKQATFYSTGEVITFLEKAGFSKFSFVQTIFRSLADIKAIEPIKKGYGSGSFVVVKAAKY